MEFLAAIGQSAFAQALKTSFYVYPLVNAAHILGLGFLLAGVTLIDLRVLGVVPAHAAPSFAFLRRSVFAAFMLTVVAGMSLFSVRPLDYAENTAFRLKLILIGLAVLNFAAFMWLDRRADSERSSLPMRLLAASSLVLWLGVLLCGRFIAFV